LKVGGLLNHLKSRVFNLALSRCRCVDVPGLRPHAMGIDSSTAMMEFVAAFMRHPKACVALADSGKLGAQAGQLVDLRPIPTHLAFRA
jgi:hypothetical protein